MKANGALQPANQFPKLSIVIAAKDEAETIGRVITQVRESLSGYDYDIIVVDDGSRDGTRQAVITSAAKVISHPRNLGKGAAMKTGVAHATGDIIVFLDGDGAHDPQEIPRLVQPIVRGEAALAIGSRAGTKGTNYLTRRMIANSLASFAMSIIVSWLLPLASRLRLPIRWVSIADCSCGFRAIRREDWFKLGLISQRFEVEAEMIYQAVRNGLVLRQVPVSRSSGCGSSALVIGTDSLKTLRLLLGRLAKDATRKW